MAIFPTFLAHTHSSFYTFAPMIQFICGIIENEDDETFVWRLYASRCENDIILKSVLDEWTWYWNFTVLYALSRTSEENVACNRGSIKYDYTIHTLLVFNYGGRIFTYMYLF